MTLVKVEDLGISYPSQHGPVRALEGVDLHVSSGEFIAIIGPSGCGKTTLLNALGGLLPVGCRQAGTIVRAEPLRRSGSLGYLTQQDTLLPWRTVLGNIEVPLELGGVPRRERRRRALHWLERFGLSNFRGSYPHQLSGGMRQRVSLIRTLIYDPELILLDEPLRSMDAQARLLLQGELWQLWRETGRTFLLVTHDIEEAVLLAERVIVLSARPGRIRREYRVNLSLGTSVMDFRWSPEFASLTRQIWQDLTPQPQEAEQARSPVNAATSELDGRTEERVVALTGSRP